MKHEKKKRLSLNWAWDLALWILLAGVLGWMIGYLWSILLVAFLVCYREKKRASVSEAGYCMVRTRGQLKYLGWGLFFAVLGGAMLWVVWYGWKHNMPMEQGEKLGFLAVGTLSLLFGLFMSYIGVKDSFFPEHSALADSIRSQLPYPDEAPPVAELFAMVDRDLRENGQRFDQVIIGREWVLGDQASYIPRIRAVFGRDEMVTRHNGKTNTTTREVELYIVDDRNQTQFTGLKNPRELPMIMDCLRLRAPDAYFGDYHELSAYRSASEEQKEERERNFRRRQEAKAMESMMRPDEPEQKVILTASGMGPTSRVDETILRGILEGEHGDEGLALVAGKPVFWKGVRYGTLWCHPNHEEGIRLILEEYVPGSTRNTHREGLCRYAGSNQEAIRILLAWAEGRIDEPELWAEGDLDQWGAIDLNHWAASTQAQSRDVPPPELQLVSAEGVVQTHNTFTREDVEVAGEGIIDGSARRVTLTLKGGYLIMWVDMGNREDGQATVYVSRPMGEELRFYGTKCSPRQAARWLLDFYDNRFSPNWREWKDKTKNFTKQ